MSILNIYFHIENEVVHLFGITVLIEGWTPILLPGFSVVCLMMKHFDMYVAPAVRLLEMTLAFSDKTQ